VVNFTAWPAKPLYPLDRSLGGFQNRFGRRKVEENLPPTGARTPIPRPSRPRPVTIPTELFRLHSVADIGFKSIYRYTPPLTASFQVSSYWTWGYHSGHYLVFFLLKCDVVYSRVCLHLAVWLLGFSILKMQVLYYSEKSVNSTILHGVTFKLLPIRHIGVQLFSNSTLRDAHSSWDVAKRLTERIVT
jgi:hypothetical protein